MALRLPSDRHRRGKPRGALVRVLAVALALALGAGGLAGAATKSTKLAPGLCETSGGGRFVAIPGFPGERIDRRLLTDISLLEKRYSIYITDGYSLDGVHAENGEHPLGLALDIVPNRAEGGDWSDIDRLARWAEPRQDHPRQPFRWVGYNGDAGHGRGNHLHLSWNHSVASKGPAHPAQTVYTIRCPRGGTPTAPSAPMPPPSEPQSETNPAVGGVKPGGRGGAGPNSGGIDARPASASPVIETGGIGVGE